MSTPVPIIRAEGEGDKRAFFGGGIHTWKLMAEDTDGAFFVFEDVMGNGKTTPLHKHPDADEMVYVIEGEIIVQVDGVERHVAAGGLSYVPKGIPHAFLVVADGTRLLSMQTPAVGQAFYRGASEPAVEGTADLLDIARLQASAQENPGVELLGPPPSFESVSVG